MSSLIGQMIRNMIRPPAVAKKIVEWFYGPDGEGPLTLLYCWSDNSRTTIAVVLHRGTVYFFRAFFMEDRWELSQDEKTPIAWLTEGT